MKVWETQIVLPQIMGVEVDLQEVQAKCMTSSSKDCLSIKAVTSSKSWKKEKDERNTEKRRISTNPIELGMHPKKNTLKKEWTDIFSKGQKQSKKKTQKTVSKIRKEKENKQRMSEENENQRMAQTVPQEKQLNRRF